MAPTSASRDKTANKDHVSKFTSDCTLKKEKSHYNALSLFTGYALHGTARHRNVDNHLNEYLQRLTRVSRIRSETQSLLFSHFKENTVASIAGLCETQL